MAFIQPCFIKKNTPELRKKLEGLGYTNIPSGEFKYLVTYPISGCYQECSGYWYEDDYDCGTNEELFLALAALRDDTNENQWFILDVEAYTNIHVGDWFIATDMNGGKHIGAQIEPTYCHKATVEEIIEHFRDK